MHYTIHVYYCSESFDKRAPKRQSGVKVKHQQYDQPQTFFRSTISDRPPATLPHTTEIKLDDSGQYDTIDSQTLSAPDSFTWPSEDETHDLTYDYVRRKVNKILRPSSVCTVKAKGIYKMA